MLRDGFRDLIDIAVLKAANAARWKAMHVNHDWSAIIDEIAERLIAPSAKAVYQSVDYSTGVPWWLIAVIHEREASQSWLANLANGDPFSRVTIHVPAGRGPFKSWEDAAVDALTNVPPKAAQWGDYSIGGSLTLLESYNGLGYAARDLPSPYIWSASDQYRAGKFVSDGHFDPAAIDRQTGCAPLLARMELLDQSIELGT